MASWRPPLLGTLGSNRSFCSLLLGRLVTNAGDSLYYIAAMWLVFELTGSPLYTGIAGFLVRAPSALGFLAGPLVDRWPLRRVLVGSQLVNGVLVLAVPVAAATGHLSVWVVLALLPLVTFVNQFVYPAQNAALPRIVDDDDLATANSLMSASFQTADMIFNAASGVLIAVVGAVALFVIDSITFGLAMLLFLGVTFPDLDGGAEAVTASADESAAPDQSSELGESAAPDQSSELGESAAPDQSSELDESVEKPAGYVAELREGIAYVRGSVLVPLVGGVVIANLAAGAMLGVLPAFAGTVGGPDAFGFLMAAYAGGTLVGTLLASRLDDRPFGWIAGIGNLLSGTLLAGALAITWFPGTLWLFFLSFVPIGAFNVLFWTTLQSAVHDDLLGRVSSLVKSAALVAIPVGSLVGGAAAGVVGSRAVVASWSVGTIFFGLYVAARPSLRSLPSAVEIDASMLRVGRRGDVSGTDPHAPVDPTHSADP